MRINNLKLKNFRNQSDLSISFEGDLTLITGENGSGKSTILESVHLLSTGRTKTSKYDKDQIQYGENFCSVEAEVKIDDQRFDMEIQVVKNPKFENVSIKKVKINKVPKSMSYFTGIFNSVLFSPQDIQLITGAPSERRKYMDDLISQVDGDYKKNLSEYLRAVRQRNKLLEKINKGLGGWDQINFYTNQILRNGKVIQEKRERTFEEIGPVILENGKILGERNTEVEVMYKKNEINEDRLEEYKNKEIAAMTTLIGPHRDDFEILFNGHDVSNFGSRGEQRSCVLALKIGEVKFIKNKKSDSPVLLLDDIFSELDDKHQKAVLGTIEDKQTIITSTSTPNFLGSDLQFFKL